MNHLRPALAFWAWTTVLACPLVARVEAGTFTIEVVDDKGSVSIPNGHFETVFASRMSLDLGPGWGELAGPSSG